MRRGQAILITFTLLIILGSIKYSLASSFYKSGQVRSLQLEQAELYTFNENEIDLRDEYNRPINRIQVRPSYRSPATITVASKRSFEISIHQGKSPIANRQSRTASSQQPIAVSQKQLREIVATAKKTIEQFYAFARATENSPQMRVPGWVAGTLFFVRGILRKKDWLQSLKQLFLYTIPYALFTIPCYFAFLFLFVFHLPDLLEPRFRFQVQRE